MYLKCFLIVFIATFCLTLNCNSISAESQSSKFDQVTSGSPSVKSSRKTNYYSSNNEQPVTADRQFGDALFFPHAMVGVVLPIAILIGIGIILIKLLILGVWALRMTSVGYGGGYGGTGYPVGGWGGGGFGGGYGGYGGYGGVGTGYGGYPGYSGGWRSDPLVSSATSSAATRSLFDKEGSYVSPFVTSTLMTLMEKVGSALENYDKKYGAKSSSGNSKM